MCSVAIDGFFLLRERVFFIIRVIAEKYGCNEVVSNC